MKRILPYYLSSFRGLPKRAWYLTFTQFINASGMMVIFFLTIFFTTKRGMTLSDAGQVVSLYGMGSMAGTYAGGIFSDKFGTHFIQRLSLVSTGILLLVLQRDMPYAITLGVAFCWGFSNGMLFPANSAAMVAECPGELRTRGFVMIRLANNLGASIGPVAGGILAQYNYSYIFIVDAVTCFLAAGMLFIFFPEKGLGKDHDASTDSLSKTDDGKTTSGLKKKVPLLLLSTLLLTTIVGQIFSTWAPYLRETEHLKESQIGLLLAISTMMIVIFQMPIIHGLRKFDNIRVAIWSGFFYFAGFMIIVYGKGITFQIVSVIVWTIGEILAFPSLMSAISQLAPKNKQGKYQGYFSLMFSAGIALGPAVGSRIAVVYSWNMLWFATSMLGLVSSLMLWLAAAKNVNLKEPAGKGEIGVGSLKP